MNTIKVFEGQELDKLIIKPLIEALTAMNKYSVLPVYMMQFVIPKLDMIPKVVLTAYDNKSLITEASSLTSHLEDVIHEKTPKTITPAVIVYPESLSFSDVVIGKDDYFYSSSYLIVGKELKDGLKNNKVSINKIELKSDSGRMHVETIIDWSLIPYNKSSEDSGEKETYYPEECISKIPFSINPLHLPFKNYLKISKSLSSIINTIANISTDPNMVIIDDSKDIASIFDDIKENQMIDIPMTNGIKIFKDFVKVKPTKFLFIYKRDEFNDISSIANVFCEMYFKSNHCNVGIFYRYLDNIFDCLSGKYEES